MTEPAARRPGPEVGVFVAVVRGGESGTTYRSWDPGGTVREQPGERFQVVLANATGRPLSAVSVAGATVTSVDDESFLSPKEPRTLDALAAGTAVVLEILEDWEFDSSHRYEVRYRLGRAAHRVEFFVSRSALLQSRWSDLPVLGVRGFRADPLST